MIRAVLAVFGKEVREALRDRRALASGLLYAVLGPLVTALALMAVGRATDPDANVAVTVSGSEHAPDLVAFLERERVTVERAPRTREVAVGERGGPRVWLTIPESYPLDFRAARPVTLQLTHDSARSGSRTALVRVRAVLLRFDQRTSALRLLARGVVPSAVRPLELDEVDVATAASRAAAALAMLPMFLLLAAFVGSLAPAIDATAGERERGSLEPLLAHPAPRLALAAGKGLASAVAAAVTVAATLGVTYAVLESPRIQELELAVGLTPRGAWELLAILLPLALLAPSLQMLVALFAKSFKEAQSYLSLLLFVPLVPGFLLAFGTVPESPVLGYVPLVGQQLLAMAVLRGEAVPVAQHALLSISTLGLAGAAVAATARLFSHEGLLTS